MRYFVAGHQGMVGGAICSKLASRGDEVIVRTRLQLDLTDQRQVQDFLGSQSLDGVVIAAAKVGGIWANNTYPAEFIYQNLMIQSNLIHGSYVNGIKRILFLGSSCIYPKDAPQPIVEEALLTGPLELTNEPYALAKIAGIKLCESYNRQYGVDYRSVMPTNLYGPGDNFHLENSHVMPALLRRFHEAKIAGLGEVVIWGSGRPRREFLHVHDLADAALFIFDLPREVYHSNTAPQLSHINIGSGFDVSIYDLAHMVATIVGYGGSISFDTEKPDGTMRKLMDSTRLNCLGWRPCIDLKVGIMQTYQWYLNQVECGGSLKR